MKRAGRGALRDAIDTILSWPDSVHDQIAQWLQTDASKPNGADSLSRRLSISGINPPGRAAAASGSAEMIKSELVQRMAAHNPHLYQRDIEGIIDAILGEIADALALGKRVKLRGFGAFSARQRPARTGRDPRTGDKVPVTEKLVPFFRTGKEMRVRLNYAPVGQGLSRADSGAIAAVPWPGEA